MTDYDPNYLPQKSFALVGQKAILLNKNHEILMLQRSHKSGAGGKWSLPGGALELNEDPYEGIKREIQEETQLTVANLQPFDLRSYTGNGDFVVTIGYHCKSITEKVVLNWEHDDFKWMTKEKALTLDLTEDGRFFLEHFQIQEKLYKQ